MSATILKQNYETARAGGIDADMAMNNPTPPAASRFSDIINETTSPSSHLDVKIIDNGTSIEFVLPDGTAQFAELAVLDNNGKTVWKTQSFNKKSILWQKQTTFGSRIPSGRYMFRMKQGNRHASGIAMVSPTA